MNTVGKIFVCLIMIMSVVFFSLTLVLYASHKTWKAESEKKSAEIKDLEEEKGRLTTVKAEAERSLAETEAVYVKTIAALKTKIDDLTAENSDLEAVCADLRIEADRRVSVIDSNSKEIEERRREIEILNQDLETAQGDRADYLKELAITINEMHDLAATRGDLETQNKELEASFQQAMNVLNQRGLQAEPDLYGETVPFKVSGTVDAIQEGPRGLIIISLGSDDGLQVSHVLDVYREDTYLGKVEVVTTEPNRAVCRILPQFRQGTIQDGDSVTSQLDE